MTKILQKFSESDTIANNANQIRPLITHYRDNTSSKQEAQ